PDAAGLLASLAHQFVDLAARLSLHPARRQPRIPPAHHEEPHGDDGPGRTVAWCRVDVRSLGRISGSALDPLPRLASGRVGAANAPLPRMVADVSSDVPGLVDLSCAIPAAAGNPLDEPR